MAGETWALISRHFLDCHRTTCERGGIEPGEEAVQMRLQRKLYAWHPECWVVDAFVLIRANPREAVRLGRKPLDLTPEDRNERDKIIRRYAAFKQRINGYGERLPDPVIEVRIQRLEVHQDILWHQIKDYGGPPEKWRIPRKAQEGQSQQADKGVRGQGGLEVQEESRGRPLVGTAS